MVDNFIGKHFKNFAKLFIKSASKFVIYISQNAGNIENRNSCISFCSNSLMDSHSFQTNLLIHIKMSISCSVDFE